MFLPFFVVRQFLPSKQTGAGFSPCSEDNLWKICGNCG